MSSSMKTGPALLVVAALAATIVFSVPSFASDPHGGKVHRRGPWWSHAPSAGGGARAFLDPDPQDPCTATGVEERPCTTSSTTGSTASTAGTTSGTTASTSSTNGSTSTTSGTTATTSTNGTTSTTSTSTGTTTGTDSSSGQTSGTNAGTSTGTDAGSTGESTGGTTGAGTTGGTSGRDDWDASGSGTTVDGVAEGGYVSGTNVNVAFTLRLVRPTGSTYDVAYLRSAVFKIGGEVDSEISQSYSPVKKVDGDGTNFAASVPVRFASTRFKDGKPVDLNAKFTYYLSSADGQRQTNPDLTYTLKTVSVVTYNKGLAWKTKQIFDDSNDPAHPVDPAHPYRTVISPTPAMYAWDAPHAIEDSGGAVPSLAAMNHSVPLGTVLKGADILGDLKHSTAVLAYTHGNADASFLTSWGDTDDTEGSYDSRALVFAGTNNEVKTAALSNRVETATGKPIPPINLAILHACSQGSNWQRLLQALGMQDVNTGQNALDRATAGFPYVVASQMWDPTPEDPHHLSTTRYLSEHAKKLYAELAAGKTIQQAVASANASFKPAGKAPGGIRDMDMTSRGDPYMRLISVYTGDAASIAARSSSPANPDYPASSNYPYIWRKVMQ